MIERGLEKENQRKETKVKEEYILIYIYIYQIRSGTSQKQIFQTNPEFDPSEEGMTRIFYPLEGGAIVKYRLLAAKLGQT